MTPSPPRRRPPRRPLHRLLVCCLGLALLWTSNGCGKVDGTGDKGYIDGKGVITVLPAKERKRPGPVSGVTLDGARVSLADYRGHVVVVNVWAQWCAPCRAETPLLERAHRELKPRGVVFLGINTRNSRADGQAFVRAQGVGYPSLYDPSGQTLLAFHGTLNPSAIPSTLVIDPQGRVAAIVLGQLTGSDTLPALVQDARRGTSRAGSM